MTQNDPNGAAAEGRPERAITDIIVALRQRLRNLPEVEILKVCEVVQEEARAKAEAKLKGRLTMEDGVSNAYRFAKILADMLEDALSYSGAEKLGSDTYRFTIGKEEVENLSFMAVQSQYAAREAMNTFYGLRGEARR